MRIRIIAFLAAFVLFVGVVIGPAQVAHAGNCKIPGIVCGWILNKAPFQIGAIQNYGGEVGRWLNQGENSSRYFADTDEVRIPAGRKGRLCAPGGYCSNVGPGDYKIMDNTSSWTFSA